MYVNLSKVRAAEGPGERRWKANIIVLGFSAMMLPLPSPKASHLSGGLLMSVLSSKVLQDLLVVTVVDVVPVDFQNHLARLKTRACRLPACKRSERDHYGSLAWWERLSLFIHRQTFKKGFIQTSMCSEMLMQICAKKKREKSFPRSGKMTALLLF